MRVYFWIALGGAIGTVARFWLSGTISERWGETFPTGTLVVNITGSFLIGFLASLTGPQGSWLAPSELRAFLMIGICGGYTTFSSFSLQTLDLMRDREWLYAGLNILGSVALCLVATWFGQVIARVWQFRA